MRLAMVTTARMASRIGSSAGRASLASDKPLKTVGSFWPYATTLFDYIHRAMPYQAPGSLEVDDTYAVAAYILSLNGILAADGKLDKQACRKSRCPIATGLFLSRSSATRAPGNRTVIVHGMRVSRWRAVCSLIAALWLSADLGAKAMAADGLTTIKSAYSAQETMARLEAAVAAKGMTVFAHIDHAAGAVGVGCRCGLPTF